MRPLRAEWATIKPSAMKLAASRSRESGNPEVAIRKLIAPFLDRLAALRVLDPACGSGNFLYVSLSLLKDLEQEVIAFAANLGLTEFEPRVNPAQLYGLEKDDFAHELASIVVWIGFLQWKLKNGYDPAGETPILKPLNNIQCLDAILVIGDQGSGIRDQSAASSDQSSTASRPQSKIQNQKSKISEPTWPECDVIVGNPPFLGGKQDCALNWAMNTLKRCFELYGDRIPTFSRSCVLLVREGAGDDWLKAK